MNIKKIIICVLSILMFAGLYTHFSRESEKAFALSDTGSKTLNFYLTVAEDDLYNEASGIISNYEQRGDLSERPVHVKVTDSNNVVLLEQDAGIRVVGQTSRSQPIKSFKLTARRLYDSERGKFKYPFFKENYTQDSTPKLITKYNSIVLRSVSYGHDTTGSLTIAAYSLARQAGLYGTPQAEPANVYLNGEYYGMCILTQSQTASTLAEMFDIDDKASIVVTQKGENQKLETDSFPQDVADYYAFTEKVQSAQTISEELLEEISQELDIEQFFTYIAVETLLGNADWPHNNFRLWRCKGNGSDFQDGKWRYLIYDTDHIGESKEHLLACLDSLFYGTSSSHILPQLMQDSDMRMELAQIYRNLMSTVFTEENIRKAFADAESDIAQDLEFYLSSERYEDYLLNDPELIASWDENSREEFLQEKIDRICQNRRVISDYFSEHFGISLLNQ